MSYYSDAPSSVRSLEQRVRNLEGSDELAIRRRVGMALVGHTMPSAAERAAVPWCYLTLRTVIYRRITVL